MAQAKVILADDHEILRHGLSNLIAKDPAFEVVGQVQDGEALLKVLKATKCDLIILDLSMPRMDGMTTIKEVHKKYPKIKILVLTMLKDQEHFRYAISYGAHGYVLKEDAYDQLMLAMKVVLSGKQYFSPIVSSLMAEQYVRSIDEAVESTVNILTKREVQVLRMVANGHSNKNIATKLKLSIRTVEAHRNNLTSKLGIKNTAALVKFAISKGLA